MNPRSTDTDALAVRRFETAAGAQIFRIPLQLFPILWGYVYLVLVDDDAYGQYRVLIDAGSGFGESNTHLEAGLAEASQQAGVKIGLDDLTHILITHGHIDHFGGLSYVRPRTQALVGVHELDLRNLTNYEERLTVVTRRLEEYLSEAGVAQEDRQDLLQLYKSSKSFFQSVRVDLTYEAAGMRLGPFEMLHVPGHCPGHVVIRLHDILFSGDHVLERISPHQSPERLTLSAGLGHYLRSLEDLLAWAGDVSLALGGHENPVTDLRARVDEIRALHARRLQQVLEHLAEPQSIADISRALFGEALGIHARFALEEAGAHVEYLYQRGRLGIENLSELENGDRRVPIRYRRL